MYIVYNKSDLRVVYFLGKKPISVSDNLGVAECSNIPEGDFDYFTVCNLETKTEKYIEIEQNPAAKTDEEGNEYESYEEKVCDLVGHKKEIVDTRSYSEKVVSLIREKYSINEELAIQRQRDTKPDEFQEYFNYCEECKAKVKKML